MKPIPTNKGYEGQWIDYQNKILVLKQDYNGNTAYWQADGTMCKQYSITGLVVADFKSKCKWFNEDWWYKKTSWGEHYPKKIYYINRETPDYPNINDDDSAFVQWSKKIDELADEQGRPAVNILKAIFKEVNKNTEMNLKFPYEYTDYGMYWYEAYVPAVDDKDNLYIITWMNCD